MVDKENIVTLLEKQIDEMAKRYAVEIELLQTIDGVGYDTAVTIISEVGADMKVFPNEQHLSSWAGMSPGNNESGGKKKCPNYPRKQIPTIRSRGSSLGSYPKERWIPKTKISKLDCKKR